MNARRRSCYTLTTRARRCELLHSHPSLIMVTVHWHATTMHMKLCAPGAACNMLMWIYMLLCVIRMPRWRWLAASPGT